MSEIDKRDSEPFDEGDDEPSELFELLSYKNALQRLAREHPKTAANLLKAHLNRERRLVQYIGGARMMGVEELLSHLEELQQTFLSTRRLRPIAFLIGRARADFETALEAGLSGFEAVAHDAMRDVMEIEFLFRDFFAEPTDINEWLTCSAHQRNSRFRPDILRQREAGRLGLQPNDLPEARDYKAHSELLHVFPSDHPMMSRGLIDTKEYFFGDAFFAEIFEHARRLLFEAHRLRRRLAPHAKSPRGPRQGLKKVRDAWTRTRELQVMWLAILEGSRERDRRQESP